MHVIGYLTIDETYFLEIFVFLEFYQEMDFIKFCRDRSEWFLVIVARVIWMGNRVCRRRSLFRSRKRLVAYGVRTRIVYQEQAGFLFAPCSHGIFAFQSRFIFSSRKAFLGYRPEHSGWSRLVGKTTITQKRFIIRTVHLYRTLLSYQEYLIYPAICSYVIISEPLII